MSRKPDFSGWATRNNLKCSDGRVITKDAFKDNDGAKVPLVWNHRHDNPLYVLGHAILENRDEGVYTYGYFNDTDEDKHAKDMVEHGDVDSLSIYANKLKQKGSSVLHGAIREVSLVLAGANPGVFIDYVSFSHGDGIEDEAIIYTGEYLEHADEEAKGEDMPEGNETNDKTVQEVFDTLTDEQKEVVYAIIGQALEENEGGESVAHADDLDEDSTVEEVFNSLTDLQKDVVYGIIGQAIEGDEEMKHNLFEGTEETIV